MDKNAVTLAEMAAPAGQAKVYPFSENFALTDSDKALGVIAHNAKLAETEVTVAAEASPSEMFIANKALIDAVTVSNAGLASDARIGMGTKLIGYDYDAAFPTLLRNLLRPGLAWFVLAAIFGAVVSSLASMLNSASTIATMDIVAKLVHKFKKTDLNPEAVDRQRTLLRGALRAHRLSHRPRAWQSEVRWDFHLHPGVPGIHQSREFSVFICSVSWCRAHRATWVGWES